MDLCKWCASKSVLTVVEPGDPTSEDETLHPHVTDLCGPCIELLAVIHNPSDEARDRIPQLIAEAGHRRAEAMREAAERAGFPSSGE